MMVAPAPSLLTQLNTAVARSFSLDNTLFLSLSLPPRSFCILLHLGWGGAVSGGKLLVGRKPAGQKSRSRILKGDKRKAADCVCIRGGVGLLQRDGVTFCALDVSPYPAFGGTADKIAQDAKWLQGLLKAWELPSSDAKVGFVDLRLLMTGTDWSDQPTLEELSIAGHARAMLDWHSQSRFCGRCGTTTVLKEAGRRRQCANDLCKKKLYPRLDPVVIMLVIDKERDCAVLGRQSRFVPRMWSCLAGFIEPGESLEEAVRREIREEVGIEVGEIIYHSSQPWPVGPSSMSCQLMVGFFAFATTFDIKVDKKELEEAKWHPREQVRKALTFNEYRSQQQSSALKVHQACAGEERRRGSSIEARVDAGELAPMFVPGPYAIAHHLISSWATEGPDILLSKV